MSKSRWLAKTIGLVLLGLGVCAHSQVWLERLPVDVLDVQPPSLRVSGMPGDLHIEQTSCRSLPEEGLRRRIVNTVVQEWAFFGFSVIDQTVERDNRWRRRPGPDLLSDDLNRRSDDDLLQVVTSVGGYWSATPDGRWMLQRQNETWKGPWGYRSDWRGHWSAAFISWVMCESGLNEMKRFQRSIAHHDYIDQAILARDGREPEAAYVAYDIGEESISAGDMLCRGSRPEYDSLDDRRAHLQQGARTHCDIVVKLDESAGEIWAIGGNVSDSVRLKRLPAVVGDNGLHPVPYNGRKLFAHLQLQAPAVEPDAIDNSPTFLALPCHRPIHQEVASTGIVLPEAESAETC